MQTPPGSASPSRRAPIDAIPEDVAILHHDVADIDANAKPHTALFGERLVGLGQIALDLDGTLQAAKTLANAKWPPICHRLTCRRSRCPPSA